MQQMPEGRDAENKTETNQVERIMKAHCMQMNKEISLGLNRSIDFTESHTDVSFSQRDIFSYSKLSLLLEDLKFVVQKNKSFSDSD